MKIEINFSKESKMIFATSLNDACHFIHANLPQNVALVLLIHLRQVEATIALYSNKNEYTCEITEMEPGTFAVNTWQKTYRLPDPFELSSAILKTDGTGEIQHHMVRGPYVYDTSTRCLQVEHIGRVFKYQFDILGHPEHVAILA